MSWNVAGLRGLLKKQFLNSSGEREFCNIVAKVNPDILLLQETKLQTIHEEQLTNQLNGVLEKDWKFSNVLWSSSTARKGYSGVATFWKDTISVQGKSTHIDNIGQNNHIFDCEGRVVTIELPFCFIMNTYFPNSGAALARLNERINVWDSRLSENILFLQKSKPVILIGDLNICPEEKDFYKPHPTQAGLTIEERDSFSEKFVKNCKMVDSFRYLNPYAENVYTFWDARVQGKQINAGFRLDHAFVTDSMCMIESNKKNKSHGSTNGVPRLFHADVLDDIGYGLSDHCPITVEIEVC